MTNEEKAREHVERALRSYGAHAHGKMVPYEIALSAGMAALLAGVRAKGAEMRDIAGLALRGHLIEDLNRHLDDVPEVPR